ncbi:MAG: hypothetical protein ACK2UO_15080 [Caldilineaceae bacterium]
MAGQVEAASDTVLRLRHVAVATLGGVELGLMRVMAALVLEIK